MSDIKIFLVKNRVIIILTLILAISIFERSIYLESRPNWYVDEGSNAIMAWNLMHGHMMLQGTEQTMVPHFPLFFLIGGLFTLLFGKTILALRILSAICIVFSTMALYLMGKEIKNSWLGIAAAASFCLISETILLTRYGFSSNLATLEILLFIFFLIRYSHIKSDKWLYASAITSALIVFTEYYLWGILIIYPVLLWRERIRLLKVLSISFSLLGIFAVIMLMIKGNWFIDDIRYYFISRPLSSALNQNVDTQTPLFRLYSELHKWLTQSPLIIIGLVGLLFAPGRRNKMIIFICFLALSVPLFLYGQPSFISRNEILLAPFLAIGIALFIFKSYGILKDVFLGSFPSKSYFTISFALFVVVIFYRDAHLIIDFLRKDPPAKISNESLMDYQNIRSTANYINNNIKKDDYVIVPDNLSFLINARTSDIFFAAAYEGTYTEITSPEFFNKNRFLFDHTPEKARYYIDDVSIIKTLVAEHPSMTGIFTRVERWPVVYTAGKFVIHQNPEVLNN